jgi:DNA-binding response OmpR family regulator
MSRRILSVSYDQALLATRKMLLEHRGYDVTSALGFSDAVEQCQNCDFDLFIIGHSIPEKDKLNLIKTFRSHCVRQSSLLSASAKNKWRVTSMLRRMILKNSST